MAPILGASGWRTFRQGRFGYGLFLAICLLLASGQASRADDLDNLIVHPDLRIVEFAQVPGARSLAVAKEIQTVFVGTRNRFLYGIHEGKRYLLASNMQVANGVAWRAPYLYIAEQTRITRYRFVEFTSTLPEGQVIFDQLPDKRHHGWRYLAIDDSGELYVSVGVACNVCIADSAYEGTILRIVPQPGRIPQIYAFGIRNSVGLDFHPRTGELWFTDNGVDLMGDMRPPDELNRVTDSEQHFGFPWFAGGTIRSFPFSKEEVPFDVVHPVFGFAAHTAPLGIHFYRSDKIDLFVGGALIALHGSWNRTVPDGYRIELLHFDRENNVTEQIFAIDGFLDLPGKKGRPVDIKTYWDGSVLVSDDSRGVIYRILGANF